MKGPTVMFLTCAKWTHPQLNGGDITITRYTCEQVHGRFGAFPLWEHGSELLWTVTEFVGVNGDICQEPKHSRP